MKNSWYLCNNIRLYNSFLLKGVLNKITHHSGTNRFYLYNYNDMYHFVAPNYSSMVLLFFDGNGESLGVNG